MNKMNKSIVVLLSFVVIFAVFAVNAAAGGQKEAKKGGLPEGFEYIQFEAESGIDNQGLWQIMDAENASGGKYIVTDAPKAKPDPLPNGAITYKFTVNKAGKYKIFVKYRAKVEGKGSYYFSLDGGGLIRAEHNSPVMGWTWSFFNNDNPAAALTFDLTAGEHKIVFHHRESPTEIDRFIISDNLTIAAKDLP